MDSGGSNQAARLWALAGSLTGPCAAILHEAGILSVGPAATLWPIAFVVASALIGLAVGRHVASWPTGWPGFVAAVPNLIVVLGYGFLFVFFGLGGSR